MDYELLTVKAAAEALYMSEAGVRRLIKSGKLEAIKQQKLLVKAESVQAYIAKQPHPIRYVSLLRYADFQLGLLESIESTGGFNTNSVEGFGQQAKFDYWRRLMALLKEVKATVRAKNYERAEELRQQLWREQIDYEMLYSPLRRGETRQKPEWASDLLF